MTGSTNGGATVKVTKQFVADFDTVCTRYNLTSDEREEAKQAARRDLDNAITTFSAMAQEAA